MYETDMDVRTQAQNRPLTREETHSSKFLSKVYGYMFIAILATALIAVAVGLGMNYALNQAIEGDTESANNLLTFILGAIIVSSIGILICSITVSIMSIRNRHSIAVPAILYTIFMGVLVGVAIFPFIMDGGEGGSAEWWIPACAFGVTAMTFGIMYIISALTKKNLNWLGTLGLGLLFGSLIIGLIYVILAFFVNNAALALLVTIVNAISFIAFLLITMWDVWRIQKIADRGYENKNLALYCAFTLYVDFVYIFLRVLTLIARIAARRR